MVPLEPWERVIIDAEVYQQDIHSYINCTDCHGGESVDDMETAHTDMIADPSADPEVGCGSCHPNVAPHAANSLHATLAGYDTALQDRSSPEHFERLEYMESFHCDSCHATCGDCHVARPDSVDGGLLNSHVFEPEPPDKNTCEACHGSRVSNEYRGLPEEIEDLPPDIHRAFDPFNAMTCTDCHTGANMHGIGVEGDDRYDGPQSPSCESCHQEQVGVGSGIEQHEIHGTEILSCQVCHSVQYNNCSNCHVAQKDGVPFFNVEEDWLGFYIGRNTLQSSERPYRYVTVRHVPIDPMSFSYYGEESDYGENLLPNYLNRPTWVYATPHNIQRNTPQTESCDSCHGNNEVFLTPDKVAPEELDANWDVIVETAPLIPVQPADVVPPVSTGDEDPADSDANSSGEADDEQSSSDSLVE